jgi:hypothetical protein
MTALDIFDDYALQIVLSTNPIGDEDKYIKHIEEKIYGCQEVNSKVRQEKNILKRIIYFFQLNLQYSDTMTLHI